MRNFSNRYIFIYITVLVAVVAVLLAMAAVMLKPLQDANKAEERIEQILTAAGRDDLSGDVLTTYQNIAQEISLPSDDSGDSLSVIRISTDGKTQYVIPLLGKGLWGAIWGYICLAQDGNTITGAIFAHKGETPGLGAEISRPEFANMFVGKLLFDETGEFVSVRVVKGGVANSNIDPKHGVDAISGGTITSNGVDKMLHDNLKRYVPFLQSLQKDIKE